MSREIENGNRLIAEFMQLKKLTETTWINPVLACSTDHLAYHESWGWLMPVLEKISTIHYGWENKEDEYDDCAYPRTFGMRDKDGNYMVRINSSQVFTANKLIEATYLAVIDFIQWFNNENKTPQP